jgi:signal transduction histidine kinase/CheY-like chemotaxis protein
MRSPHGSGIIAPIRDGQRTLGALTLVSFDPERALGPLDAEFAEDLGRSAGLAVSNIRLHAAQDKAREAAEGANRAKDEFLAMLSHELRTPLNSVLGWSRLHDDPALDAARRARAHGAIQRNAQAMAQLIDDLLDVSRLTSGRLRLDVASVDLREIADAALEVVRPAIEAKHIHLLDRGLAGPAIVRGDAIRLQLVVWNVLSNAVKFTPAEGHIEFEIRQSGSAFELRIADDGAGMRPEILPFVFEPFFQADTTIRRAKGGLGLGLAIAKQITELHGGSMQAKSDGPGRGAAFVIRIPARGCSDPEIVPPRAASARLSAKPIAAPSALAGLRVLVVDDEDDARAHIAGVLESRGCSVTPAASVREAIVAFQAERPELVLCDIGMPGESGFDFIAWLRGLADARARATPVVAVTAYARASDRNEALAAGFSMHLSKPVDPAELVSAVAAMVELGQDGRFAE